MKPEYEVRKGTTVSGLFTLTDIQRELHNGRYQPEDSYRKKGRSPWRPIMGIHRRNKLIAAIFWTVEAIGFLCGGLFALHLGLQLVHTARESSAWPSVPGKITFSKVEISDEHSEPLVLYRYQVGSEEMVGSWISPEVLLGTYQWAQSIVSRYPEGCPCSVYYDPEHPHLSILEPGVKPGSYKFLLIGASALYLGVLLAWLALKAIFQEFPKSSAAIQAQKKSATRWRIAATPGLLVFVYAILML